MRFMNWSCDDFFNAPAEYVAEIIQVMNEIAEKAELDELTRS
jgi:hypothetical protein